MATAPMTIGTFLKVAPVLPPSTSILLKGNHGIGKSQLGRQIAARLRKSMTTKFPVIDRRLSQCTEGDIIGLPSTDGAVTRFNPPDWYKQACEEPCFLFLDEINRATPEVMQAAFQIVLDRELNGWKLHKDTRVMSAINAAAAYTVNEVDPALLDRFWCVDLHATHKDWLDWARSTPVEEDEDKTSLQMRFNIDPVIADFIMSADGKWLDPIKNAEPSAVEPSRRSWDRLSMALTRAKLTESPNDPMFYAMCCGFIGLEATIAFVDFAKTIDNQVTGKEVLNDFERVKTKINRLGPEKQNIVIDKISDYILKEVKTLTDKQGANLKAFTQTLSYELRLTLWSKLTTNGTERIELARSVHKYIAKDVLDVFGVPMGEAGIGVIPKIPGIFKDGKK